MTPSLRQNFRSATAFLALACQAVPLCGQQRPDTVDAIVSAEGLARGVPGLAVAVVHGGRVLVQRGYGIADVTTGRSVTPSTPFNIASVTKPFAAAVLMQLVREQRVQLDAAASRYLALPEGYRTITVRQLLTHTSGIARDLRSDNFDDPDADEYRRRLDASNASSAPGSQYEYSNTGFTVLGMLIESVERQPLAQVFQSRLFEPIGMHNATYRPTPGSARERARPHTVVEGEPQRASVELSGGFGSGGMLLSAGDAAAFALALQDGRVLTTAEQSLAWAPGRLSNGGLPTVRIYHDSDGYGFGWILSQFQGRRLITHGGGIEGHSANLYHFPDERLTIFVMANVRNRDDGRTPVDPIARRLAEYYLTAASRRE